MVIKTKRKAVVITAVLMTCILVVAHHKLYFTDVLIPSTVDRQVLLARLKGPVDQEDENLVNYVRRFNLEPPSNFPYNFSENVLVSKIRLSNNFRFINDIVKSLFSDSMNGFFVEAGALDGEYLSNTLWLEQKLNWTGLLVEPDDTNFRDLVFKRRKSWISHSCLSSERYPRKIVMVSTKMRAVQKTDKFAFRGSAYELGLTFPDHGSGDMVKVSDKQYFTSQCFPLYSHLLALNVSVIDFLSLDLQGSEIKVFDTLPLDKIKVRAVVVESETKDLNRDFIKYFNDKGFIWLAAGGAPDFFFVHKNDTLVDKFVGTPSQTYFDQGINFSFYRG